MSLVTTTYNLYSRRICQSIVHYLWYWSWKSNLNTMNCRHWEQIRIQIDAQQRILGFITIMNMDMWWGFIIDMAKWFSDIIWAWSQNSYEDGDRVCDEWCQLAIIMDFGMIQRMATLICDEDLHCDLCWEYQQCSISCIIINVVNLWVCSGMQ